MGVRHIHSAKQAKNDEFYTRFEDVENEIRHYADFLAGKHIWCPCDSAESAFWKFLHENFDALQLASLTATSRDQSGGTLLVARSSEDFERMHITSGDMFSDECQQFFFGSDVVITNPPFSEFRRIIRMCKQAGKDFVLVAPVYALTYNIVFDGLKSGEFRMGFTRMKALLFDTPSGDTKQLPVFFLTSLPIAPDVKPLPARRETMHKCEHLAKFDALNVSCVKDIPRDAQSAIALPVTSMRSFDPETLCMTSEDGAQFRVLEKLRSPRIKESGRKAFARVIIKEI